MATEISGNILVLFGNPQNQCLIVHQVNADPNNYTPKGLSKEVFDAYPYANIYNGTIRVPGTIIISRQIVNLVGQKHRSKANKTDDTSEMRLGWFISGLHQLRDVVITHKVPQVAFPYGIGCGLAGGDWNLYRQLIDAFAKAVPDCKVWISRL